MFSTPLIFSSMGEATVSAMTLGLAPGYCARTITEGGTTSGYSAVGNANNAMTPASRMTIDRTPAKMGRSMKNLEMFMMKLRAVLSRSSRRFAARHGGHVNGVFGHPFTRPYPLHAVDHDTVALAQASLDDAQAFVEIAQAHLAVLDFVVRIDDKHELLRLVGADGHFVHHHCGPGFATADLHAGIQPRNERAVCVVECRTDANGPGCRVEPVVDGDHRAVAGVPG